MQTKDIKLGGRYTAKISGRVVEVQISDEHPNGGWTAKNLKTSKTVRIRSARKLRSAVGEAVEPKKRKLPKAAVITDTAVATIEPTDANKAKPLSALKAVETILRREDRPMTSTELTEEALKLGWQPSGKTPERTLYACLFLDMKRKGIESRFKRSDKRGYFELTTA